MSTYDERGVSASKPEVHAAVDKLDKGLFPGAFCKIIEDSLTGDPNYCLIQHSDGAGTKAALAYLAWQEGIIDIEAWEKVQWDSLIMNFDDLGCAGALGPFIVTSTINRNKFLIPGEVIAILINRCQQVADSMTTMGIPCVFAGGETADVPDLVRTITIDNTVTARMLRSKVVNANRMVPGDVIVGFSSTGQAAYESRLNSGAGSNGFTNGRHDSLWPGYGIRFPETYSPEMKKDLVYRGKFFLDDRLPGDEKNFSIAEALLSPTRTYLPLIKALLETIPMQIHGLIHCSGGGQSKIKNFGQPGNIYVKDNLFEPPPLFLVLQEASGATWKEMYQVYNMGHRLEAVVPEIYADGVIDIAKAFDIPAKVVGHVEAGKDSERWVAIKCPFDEFTYGPDD